MTQDIEIVFEWKHKYFPYIGEIIFLNANYVSILVIVDPTLNCQLFTVGNIESLVNLRKQEYIDKIMSLLKEYVGKQIMAIDVREKYLDTILEKLKPYYDKVEVKKYTSTNKSRMAICLVYLNIYK